VDAAGFNPKTPNPFDMSKLVRALDPLIGIKAPTFDTSKLMQALDPMIGIKVPTFDTSKLMQALDPMIGIKVPTFDTSKLMQALDPMIGIKVPTFDTGTLRLLDGYSGRSGTRLDNVGSLYSLLEDTQLLPHLDDAADAVTSRGPLRWNYNQIRSATGSLVESFENLEPSVRAELDDRTEGARDALSVTNAQLEQSLALLGVRDALKFYGAAARTPLATFAAMVIGGGWYLLSWGSAGDAILVGAGVFHEARRRLGALHLDE
jgi:hypothetical protein